MEKTAPLATRLSRKYLLRGAAMAEYLPIVAIGMLSAGIGFQRYGGVVAEHMAEVAAQVGSNYYQGWFYPEGTSGLAPMGGESTRSSSVGPIGWGTSFDPFPTSSGLAGGSSIHGSPVDPTNDNPLQPPGGDPIFPPGGGWGDPFLPPGGDPQQCGIPGGDFSPAPFPSVGSNNTSLGNPIDFGNGNKFQTEVDYQHFYAQPLVFARFYNSVQTNNALSLGHGWRHSYQRSIQLGVKQTVNNSAPQNVFAVRDDGAVFVFNKGSEGDDNVWLGQGVVDQLERTDTGWRYSTVSGQVETYNLVGQLTQVEFPNGISHRLVYDGENLVAVVDSRGPELRLHYKDQWLVRVVLPNEETLRFQYSEQGNLQAYQRALSSGWAQLGAIFDASTATYHYENTQFTHALTGLSDAEGKRFATWGYDSLGRANLSEHGQGVERYTLDYRDDGTVAATNAAGLVTVFHLESARPGHRRLASIEGLATPTCPQIRKDHRYNAQGFLALSIDAEGNAVKWTRNDRGLVIEEQNGLRSQQGEWLAVEGASRVTREWDANRPLVVEEIYSSFYQGKWQSYKKWDFIYNDAGRITQRTATDLTPFTTGQPYSTYGDQRSWTYSYKFNDQYANKLESVSVNGPRAARDDGSDDITTEYFNSQGLLVKVENALGHVTEITDYNAAGFPTSATLPTGARVLLSYNAQQLVTDITRQSADGTQSEHTQLTYFKNGLLQKLSLADGSWQAFEYNDARQMISITNNWGDAITVAPSTVSGEWTEQVVYNSQGHVVRKSERALDSLGRVIKILGQHGQQTELNYNKVGNLASVHQLGINSLTQRNYDSLQRLTSIVDALQGSSTVGYGVQGRTAAFTDAKGSTTRYRYNGFGDVIQLASPDTGTVIRYYDQAGNVVYSHRQLADGEKPDPEKTGVRYGYDMLNRARIMAYPDTADNVYYIYDQTDAVHGAGVGHLTHIKDSTGLIDYQYDALGRVVRDMRSFMVGKASYTYKTGYRYYHGKIAAITYPDGQVAQYKFDKDRLTTIQWQGKSLGADSALKNSTLVDKLVYQTAGQIDSWRYGSGITQTETHDTDGRLTRITLAKNDGAVLVESNYQHDQLARIISISTQEFSATSQQTFAYDDLYRLVQDNGSYGEHRYQYDAVGNRIEHSVTTAMLSGTQTGTAPAKPNPIINPVVTTPTVVAKGSPMKSAVWQWPENYRYQQQGSKLVHSSDQFFLRGVVGNREFAQGRTQAQNSQYVYDALNRPTGYYENNELVASYAYNALGQRSHKYVRSAGAEQYTVFHYGLQGQLLGETVLKPTGDIQHKNYVWLASVPIAQIETVAKKDGSSVGNTISYLHPDHLGTPRYATDVNQQLVWQWRSDAFGVGDADSDVDANGKDTVVSLRFTGQYHDLESDLFYNYFRTYDPKLGRYTQSDPIGLSGGVNTYAYVGNNPVSGVDPLGLFKVKAKLPPLIPEDNPIHESIVQEAFNRFLAANPGSFSQHTVNLIINTGLHTDLTEEGQFSSLHFDQPVDPTPGAPAWGKDGKWNNQLEAPWIKSTMDKVTEKRDLYAGAGTQYACSLDQKPIFDISGLLEAFGNNTHTLADFYAHSNWVDDKSRGGIYMVYEDGLLGKTLHEAGSVPNGLEMSVLWNEDVSEEGLKGLYSGHADGCADFSCVKKEMAAGAKGWGNWDLDDYFYNVEVGRDDFGNEDKTTHAYWAKDSIKHTLEFSDTDASYQMARNLAISHTVQEIELLWNKAASTPGLREVFGMTVEQKKSSQVTYNSTVVCDVCYERGNESDVIIDYVGEYMETNEWLIDLTFLN